MIYDSLVKAVDSVVCQSQADIMNMATDAPSSVNCFTNSSSGLFEIDILFL